MALGCVQLPISVTINNTVKKVIIVKKQRIALILGTLLLCVSTTAHAQTYIALSGGLSMPNDGKNKGEFTANVPATAAFPAITNGTALSWDTEYENGLETGFQIGHRFNGGIRIEADFRSSKSGIDKHSAMMIGTANIDGRDSAILTRRAASATNPTVGTLLNSGTGSQKSSGAFINVFYDFNSKGAFIPYIGAGAGVQETKLDFRPSDLDIGQEKSTDFAWQVMAGATVKLGEKFELFGQYSYRDACKAAITLDLLPARIEANMKQSIFSAGVRFTFGGK